jgi:hypothetical protein
VELDRLSKNKKDKKMSILSLKKNKIISRNKPLKYNINNSNSSLNYSFNNRILKYTSFVASKNKKFPINIKKMNIWRNKKLKLITNKSLMNNSMNISINEHDKKSMNPLNTTVNHLDNFWRNKFFFIGKNRLIKKEMQHKIKKALADKPWIQKNSHSIIDLSNRYNIKKSISKKKEQNQPKHINNFPSRNSIKNAINNINNKSITMKNQSKNNIQNLSQTTTQINCILNNKRNISGNLKINNINNNKPDFTIKDKKNFNKYNFKKPEQIINNININKSRDEIEEKEMNEPIIEDNINEMTNNINSSLDNTIKFSINSSKVEDEGELGIDEVRDIIVYYKLDEEKNKNYLFENNDYIDFIKSGKNIYLKYFWD